MRTSSQPGLPGSPCPTGLRQIGSDKISITASKDYTLRIGDDAEELKATKIHLGGTSDLLFDDLKNRFVTRAEKREYGGATFEYVVPVERSLGEGWELVD